MSARILGNLTAGRPDALQLNPPGLWYVEDALRSPRAASAILMTDFALFAAGYGVTCP
jgi:hypothetical protein